MEIMGFKVKEVTIKPQEIKFDMDGKKNLYLDSKGKVIKKIQVSSSEYKWVYEDGTEYFGKEYKSLNGKPIKSFIKTNVIDKYDIIDKADASFFVNNELTYLLVNSEFKEKIKELNKENKAVSFKYVIRGFKIYKAVISYCPELDRVFMRCYRGDVRKADLTEAEQTTIIELEDDVEELSLDDLEV